METALSQHFLVADTLVPQWPRSIYRNGAEDLVRDETYPPMSFSLQSEPDGHEATRRLHLRDTLTAFALAYELNSHAFVTVASSYMHQSVVDSLTRNDRNPRLRLKVVAAVGSKAYGDAVGELTALFNEWSDPKTTRELRRFVDQFLPNCVDHNARPSAKFDLTVQLDLLRGETFHSRVYNLVKMVQSIDRAVFNITDVRLTVREWRHEYADDVWEELFHLLHSLWSDANIHVQIQLPSTCGIGFPPLVTWKRRFDLLTRSPHAPLIDTQSGTTTEWNVELQYQRPEYSTSSAARAIVSSLSALAHATIPISSLRIQHVLRGGSGGLRFGKWMGYLLQANVIESLHWTDTFTARDVDDIVAIMAASSQRQRLQRLWLADFRDDGLGKIASVRQSLADESQFVGVMHDDARDDCLDVHLVGFGQCRVDRRLASAAMEKLERRAKVTQPAPAMLLRSLALALDPSSDSESALRLISLVGSSLEALELTGAGISLASVVAILVACPRLLRLSIKSLSLTAQGDDVARPLEDRVLPLESLSVDVNMNGDSSGLLAFARLVQRHTPKLTDFRLWVAPRPHAPIDQGNNTDDVARAFRDSLPIVTHLDVSGIQIPYFGPMLTQETTTCSQTLETLKLERVAFTDVAWKALMDALSSDHHWLARSLRKLVLRVDDPHAQRELEVAAMLEKNRALVDVRVVFQGRGEAANLPIASPTHGASIRKSPLPIHHKLALLSAIQSTGIPQDPDAFTSIFEFAALAKTRHVRLTCTATSPPHWSL